MPKLISDLENKSIAIKIGNEYIKLNVLSTADNTKFNKLYTHVHQLYHASDLSRVLNYLAKIKCIDYKVTLNGVEYDIRDSLVGDENTLPDLNEVLDYYGINDLIATVNELKEGGSGNGLSLFDVIAKDHILMYGKDLEGFAPLGTWVYKEAVAGSRYGYPDFYEKCLEEYNEGEVVPYLEWKQPVLSANGTLGGDSFAVSATTQYDGNYAAWKAVNGVKDTYAWLSSNGVRSADYIFYNPTAILVKKLTITNRGGTDVCCITTGTMYGSNDNENWTELTTFTNDITAINGEWDIELPSNYTAYKYHKLSVNTDSSHHSVGIGELTIEAYQILARKHSNGHIYFDVADLDKVNELYEERGEAWLFGIDTENEKVFLPRSTRIKFSTPDEVGQYQEAGLPNHTHSYSFLTSPDMGGNPDGSGDSGGSYWRSGAYWYGATTGNANATASAAIYGKSDTVEYSATKLIPYMVVGNAKVEKAITDVVDVTTTENDTIPLFAPHYFDYTVNNLSWLKAGDQSVSGKLYATCYNELVKVLQGDTKYGALKVVDKAEMVEGEDYSFYWIVDQVNEVFKTPAKVEQRFVIKAYQSADKSYRIYNDGYCEQSFRYGSWSDNPNIEFVLTFPYIDMNYNIICELIGGSKDTYTGQNAILKTSTSRFSVNVHTNDRDGIMIYTAGYIDLTNESFPTALYFKVANAVEDIQLLTAGATTEVLNGKVNRIDTEWATDACAPDYSAAITISTTGEWVTYTAPCVGLVMYNTASQTTYATTINGTVYYVTGNDGYNEGPMTVLLNKGDTIRFYNDNCCSYFVPYKGAN